MAELFSGRGVTQRHQRQNFVRGHASRAPMDPVEQSLSAGIISSCRIMAAVSDHSLPPSGFYVILVHTTRVVSKNSVRGGILPTR